MVAIKNNRRSNIELLRCLAMFLVLVFHADYFSLGAPTLEDISVNPLDAYSRVFIESLSVVCVNVFVLISGWFGIRPKIKSISKFIFQCLFFLIGIYVVMMMLGLAKLNIRGVLGCFVMLKWNWFIKAYLCLYILSPVLNAFVENTDKRTFQQVLFFFFLFQTVYSWLTSAAQFFENGFSSLSFMGLYLLARYVNKYQPKWSRFDKKIDISIYMIIAIFGTEAVCIIQLVGNEKLLSMVQGRLVDYSSPLVIIASLYLLLYFSKLSFSSKVINWLGASSFAVFLLHANPNLCEQYYKRSVQYLYSNYEMPVLLLFCLTVFMGGGNT